MKILVYKIPTHNGPKGLLILEEQKELLADKEEIVKETDHMKVLAQVNNFNQTQLTIAGEIKDASYILRKIIVE